MVYIRKLRIKGSTYLVEVKSFRENGKVKQKYIHYLGRLENNQLIPPKIERLKVKSICSFGIQLVLNKIIENFKLDEVVDERLIALAMLNIIQPGPINKAIPNFYKYSLGLCRNPIEK